jgi:hypothetical protein
MKESDLQNQIRIALSPHGTFFRANVGQGWTGTKVLKLIKGKYMMEVDNGDILIKNAHPFQTGLPTGFPDLFGFPAGVPIFTGIEIKTQTGQVRPEQEHMIEFLRSKGCRVGIARSVEDAIRIARGE